MNSDENTQYRDSVEGDFKRKALRLNSKTFREFLRYAIVGGISFLADTGVMILCREVIFNSLRKDTSGLFLSVAAGFLAGLTVNYLLSQFFVFVSEEQKPYGRNWRAFFRFAIIGLIGFGLTELGMYLGILVVGQEGFQYVLVKCIVAGIVLIWNYLGRKIWVYQGN